MLPALLISVLTSALVPILVQSGGAAEVVFAHQGTNGNLGFAVASPGDVNGDGIPDYMASDPSGDGRGFVNVYSGANGSLLHQIFGQVGSVDFGEALGEIGDLDGDGFDDIFIGEPGLSSSGPLGAARVYSGATANLLLEITASAPFEFVEMNLAGLGDINGDGVVDFLIGAPRYDLPGKVDAGAVFVYSGSNGTVLYSFFGAIDNARLGSSVSGAGDLNGDAIEDFLIGHIESWPVIQAGGITAYSGFNGTQIFTKPGPLGSGFGRSVVGGMDLNQDGVPDFVAGATEVDCPPRQSCGSAFAFSGADTTLLFRVDGRKTNERVGSVLALVEDLDEDGAPDLLVGVPNLSWNDLTRNGAIRIYSGGTGTLLREISGSKNNVKKGSALSRLGDLDGDGRSEFLVGDPSRSRLPHGRVGQTQVFSFDPFMRASATDISHATGGTVQLQIDFPSTEAGFSYGVLMSRHGLGPTPFRGASIPLTRDHIYHLSVTQNLPSYVGNANGTLDLNGDAMATFTVPQGSPSVLINTTRWFAVVSIHPTRFFVREVTVAIPVAIIP